MEVLGGPKGESSSAILRGRPDRRADVVEGNRVGDPRRHALRIHHHLGGTAGRDRELAGRAGLGFSASTHGEERATGADEQENEKTPIHALAEGSGSRFRPLWAERPIFRFSSPIGRAGPGGGCDGSVVTEPEEAEDGLDVFLAADRLRHPAAVPDNVMRKSLALGD